MRVVFRTSHHPTLFGEEPIFSRSHVLGGRVEPPAHEPEMLKLEAVDGSVAPTPETRAHRLGLPDSSIQMGGTKATHSWRSDKVRRA